MTEESGGTKYDVGKTQFSLLDPEWLTECAEALTIGAEKYGVDNWKGLSKWRVVDALFRHCFAFLRGEVYDEETCKHHLAHAHANLMFLWWLDNNKGE